ncbi:hypothetical protein LEP1GSC021_1820 [Leptospira noguchii str. 1993005606]|uniref:Uncharacterized protein n=2 Tax=Leptospira noguchii TaxID=28182 RepID=M6YL40_9LEPT|nr:hypothetical protein LEP1GSC035_1882 [Leptospira noguchii str. 2007001578]EMO87053.1 hypothetical protein LEP1GSC024_0629 [Leptospira noguchii str. 2001034031]EPE81847.1 hypothetical protein LEP1GSC021_1820 [Leptospira noguchii str. 1993005606]
MKTKIDFKLFLITTLTSFIFGFFHCGYNTIQEEDEAINAS